VYGILFAVFGSARQKGADEKFRPKRKIEAGGSSNLRNLYSYRSTNLYVIREWWLKHSCEVLVAKSDVKGRIGCEDINVDPNWMKDKDFINLLYGASQGQIIANRILNLYKKDQQDATV